MENFIEYCLQMRKLTDEELQILKGKIKAEEIFRSKVEALSLALSELRNLEMDDQRAIAINEIAYLIKGMGGKAKEEQ